MAYSNVYLSKHFINEKHGKWSLPWTPLVRTLLFSATTASGEIVAIFHDASHKILVKLSRKAIVRFEQTHGQRITFETIDRLMLIRQASLKFVSAADKVDFSSTLATLGGWNPSVSCVYLEVHEIEFYSRDRLFVPNVINRLLRLVYRDVSYSERFGAGHLHSLETEDDLVSDPEQIDENWDPLF